MTRVKSTKVIRKRESLPRTIKIGINTYELIFWDPEQADLESLLGKCCVFDFKTWVRTDLPDSGFAETLEHEINHACWAAAKLKSRAHEETVINRLTPIQIAARRDNPEIYEWIDWAVRKS